MNKIFLIYIVSAFLTCSSALAASGDGGIPVWTILAQTFNLLLLVALLAFFLRKKVAAHFHQRKESFSELLLRAERSKKEAEKSRNTVKSRLEELETEAQQSLEKARAEALELQQRMVKEAKELAEKLEAEAARTAEYELERAKEELRAELLNSALSVAKEAMKTGVSDPDQKRLQTEFVEKIQVVNS